MVRFAAYRSRARPRRRSTGQGLIVPLPRCRTKMDEEEFYHADLVGLGRPRRETGEDSGQGDGRAKFRRRRHRGGDDRADKTGP